MTIQGLKHNRGSRTHLIEHGAGKAVGQVEHVQRPCDVAHAQAPAARAAEDAAEAEGRGDVLGEGGGVGGVEQVPHVDAAVALRDKENTRPCVAPFATLLGEGGRRREGGREGVVVVCGWSPRPWKRSSVS